MTRRILASVAAVACMHVASSGPAHAEPITLEQALKRAQEHPEVALGRAEVDTAAGNREQAGTIAFNPQLTGGLGPRFGSASTMLDFELGLTQTIELGGKRKHRAAVAAQRLNASRSRLRYSQQRLAVRVRYAFAAAVAAKTVFEATMEAEEVAAELEKTSAERMARGAGTKLEVNLAAAGVGRARRRRMEAQRKLISAEYALAAAVGAKATVRLQPTGSDGRGAHIAVAVERLVATALENRGDLTALGAEQAAAAASVKLADSLGTPNLGFGANYAHEEGADQILAVLAINLPIWNRNRGGRKAARANLRRTKIAMDYGKLEVARQVRAAAARYQTAREATTAFEKGTIGSLKETLSLTREAFERGKISMLEFNLLRREFVDARLAYLEAVNEEIDARFELERAVGGTISK